MANTQWLEWGRSHGKDQGGYSSDWEKAGQNPYLFFNTRMMILSLSEKQVSQLKETINRRGLKNKIRAN
jgi:oligoendopeptidase F